MLQVSVGRWVASVTAVLPLVADPAPAARTAFLDFLADSVKVQYFMDFCCS